MSRTDPAGIVDRLETEYRASVEALRNALRSYIEGGPAPDPGHRRAGAFVYPELRLNWPAGRAWPRLSRAYARIGHPGR
jgi:AMP nucleosidase